MVFLILNVLMSSVMMLVFKLSSKKAWNGDKIILVNYMTAAACSLVSLLVNRQGGVSFTLAQAELATLFTRKTLANSAAVGLLFGLAQGFLFVMELMLRSASTDRNGAGITIFFSKAAFVGNITLSALIWRELPTVWQWTAILMILLALAMTSSDLKHLRVRSPLLLGLLVLSGTLLETMNKAVTVYVLPEHNALYLTITFCVALAVCIGRTAWACVREKKRFEMGPAEWAAGGVLGLSNVLATSLSLKALELLPASVVFSTQAAGNLLLVFLMGRFVFKEPASRNLVISIAIAVVSLVLIHL